MAVFWFVAPCPDDGGSKRLCNIGKFLPYYTEATTQKAAIFESSQVWQLFLHILTELK
jgi:hypothetical protein